MVHALVVETSFVGKTEKGLQNLKMDTPLKVIKTRESRSDWPVAEIAIIEVASKHDLDTLRKATQRASKTVAILYQLNLLNDVLEMGPNGLQASPFEETRLTRIIDKLREAVLSFPIETHGDEEVIGHTLSAKREVLLIPTQEGIEVIRHDEITRIEADRAYCVLHQKNGRRLMISKPLRELKDQLPAHQFFRCHSSHLVRLSAVVAYRKEGGGVLVLCDGSHVPVAKARKEEMVRVLGGEENFNAMNDKRRKLKKL